MLAEYFNWFKALHIISMVCWMSAMFYLPRLFVYHTKAKVGSELDNTLQIMERKLQRLIMNPAMIGTYIFGFIVAYIYGMVALGTWFYIKLLAVLGITIIHGFFAYCRKLFVLGKNHYSEKFYRLINEVPPVLMVIAIIMVVIKPFE